MMVPNANQMSAVAHVAFDPSKTPAGKMLAWWREHETAIVWILVIGGGLFTVATVFAAVKAAPLAAKAAPHLMKYAATKYPMLAAATAV